ncbi:MAG: guanylate kinase [Pseudomonadota bacterium]
MSSEPMDDSQFSKTDVRRRGVLLVVSSPSGAGKTTLARRLLEDDGGIELSVSVTTRPARPGEVDGRDYHFVDMGRFQEMRDAGDLLEWAEVFGNFYGTPRQSVDEALSQGRDLLFDIDWQGAQQLAERTSGDLVRVFILPPSARALEERLTSRNQDSAEVVAQRMSKAADEISHWNEYDFVIVNQDVEHSLAGLKSVLAAARVQKQRQTGLPEFVDALLGDL